MLLWMNPDQVERDRGAKHHQVLDDGFGGCADRTSKVPMRIAVMMVVVRIGWVAGFGFVVKMFAGEPSGTRARARVGYNLVCGNPQKGNYDHQPEQSHQCFIL